MKSFEEQMQIIKNLDKNYSGHKVLTLIIETTENFLGNERFLLLSAIYEIIYNKGKNYGITDLANRILDLVKSSFSQPTEYDYRFSK